MVIHNNHKPINNGLSKLIVVCQQNKIQRWEWKQKHTKTQNYCYVQHMVKSHNVNQKKTNIKEIYCINILI